VKFYECEIVSDGVDDLLTVRHYLWGRLVLEELWHYPKGKSKLWGVTLFDFVTISVDCLMTVEDRFFKVAKPRTLEIPKERYALFVGRPGNAQVSPT
jgi:hypothetical protein